MVHLFYFFLVPNQYILVIGQVTLFSFLLLKKKKKISSDSDSGPDQTNISHQTKLKLKEKSLFSNKQLFTGLMKDSFFT